MKVFLVITGIFNAIFATILGFMIGVGVGGAYSDLFDKVIGGVTDSIVKDEIESRKRCAKAQRLTK